jgi:hypothetical protein
MKRIVSGFVAGILVAKNGFDLPLAALPSFAFIFLVYGALILWELRVLLPSMRLSPQRGKALRPAFALRHFRFAHRS